MITLTMKCSRCSKEVSHDITNERLNEDMIRKFGFSYVHTGKKNVLICQDCEGLHKEVKAKLEGIMKTELCNFFTDCEKEGKNGENGRTNNG